MKRLNFRSIGAVLASLFLAGCATTKQYTASPIQKNVLQGPIVTKNATPLEESFACLSDQIVQSGKSGLSIAVGNIKDYTGKFSEGDGGNPITQGGSLMVSSALGKLGSAIKMRERFDTQITEIELAYLNKQYLGDGQVHRISDPKSDRVKNVRWMPYTGGSILKSDYYIVGGITELNYNIQSGGAELFVTGVGAMHRVFVLNVAVDLRIVNTENLTVEKVVSLQKQLLGYEVGTNIFRFWGDRLVDFNSGRKRQEPLQMGVRTALEMGVLELISHVTGVSNDSCLIEYRESDTKKKSRKETIEVGDEKSADLERQVFAEPSDSEVNDPLMAPLKPQLQKIQKVGADSKDSKSLGSGLTKLISRAGSARQGSSSGGGL